jgi:YD repeat-containing protein
MMLALGVIETLTGPNQLTTEWQYDEWGRKQQESRADGTFTTWTRTWADNCEAAHPQALWCLTVENQATDEDGNTHSTGISNTQFDKLGRQVRSVTTGFDGRYSLTDQQHDTLGRVVKVSRPYFEGDTIHWSDSQYDDLGRVTQVSTPGPKGDTISIHTDYNGLTTTVTDAKGQTKTTVNDVMGRAIRVSQEENTTLTYTYDALGNLLTTTDPEGHVTTLTYDIRGNKKPWTTPPWAFGSINTTQSVN